MERVHSSSQRALGEIGHVAIAIKAVNDSQRHIGILHRGSGSKEALLLNLAWHHDLKNEAPTHEYLWIESNIPTRRAIQVATLCRKIWRSNDSVIPFAFSIPNDCFDTATGKILLGPTRLGLTCATFVIAVFRGVGIHLIEPDTWPARDDDVEWQRRIVQALRSRPGASDDHIEAIESEIGCVRFRPEEVAGAGMAIPPAADFATASANADQILHRLYS